MMLDILGNEVRTAHDGLEAVDLAANFNPEVVLMDIGLPMLNGYDAARRMRDQPGGDDMVLVALTGWGQEEDRRRSQEAGFDLHIVKPVDPVALEKLLDGLETTATRTVREHRSSTAGRADQGCTPSLPFNGAAAADARPTQRRVSGPKVSP